MREKIYPTLPQKLLEDWEKITPIQRKLILARAHVAQINHALKKRHVRYMAFFIFFFLQFSSMLLQAQQINNEKAIYAAFLATGYLIVLFTYAWELITEKRKQSFKAYWV